MGERGPAKTPSALTVLHGNPGKRPVNEKEPKPALPAKKNIWPDWLKETAKDRIDPKTGREIQGSIAAREAKKEFDRIVPGLRRIGLLTELDPSALIRYCVAHGEWVECTQYCMAKGTVNPVIGFNKSGERYVKTLKAVPQIALSFECAKIALQLGARFGLTPSDRTRIQIDNRQISEDEMESFLFGNDGREAK